MGSEYTKLDRVCSMDSYLAIVSMMMEVAEMPGLASRVLEIQADLQTSIRARTKAKAARLRDEAEKEAS